MECLPFKNNLTYMTRSSGVFSGLLGQSKPTDTGELAVGAKSLCPFGTEDLRREEASSVFPIPETVVAAEPVASHKTLPQGPKQECAQVAEFCASWEESVVQKYCCCCIGLSYELFSVRLNVDGLT